MCESLHNISLRDRLRKANAQIYDKNEVIEKQEAEIETLKYMVDTLTETVECTKVQARKLQQIIDEMQLQYEMLEVDYQKANYLVQVAESILI